jgi:hypothetical protein
MRRFLLGAAVVSMSMVWGGTATAGGNGGQSGSYQGCYHQNYGTKCSYGYCYKGKNHCHWSSSCYSPEYGCTTYRCPSTGCDYYWCGRDDCYYPTHYRPYGRCR